MRSVLVLAFVGASSFASSIEGLFRDRSLTFVEEIRSEASFIDVRESVQATTLMEKAKPGDFARKSRVSPESIHTVVFATKYRNVEMLADVLASVSDPFGDSYGHHLSKADVDALVSNPRSAEHIMKVLKKYGVEVVKTSKNGEYITAKAAISIWENILGTTFYEFESESVLPGKKFIRSLEYSLPENLLNHVSAVFNTVQFPQQRDLMKPHKRKYKGNAYHAKKTLADSGIIEDRVTPQFLNEYYNIFSNVGNNLTSQAFYSSLEQTFSPKDLRLFQEYFNLPIDPLDVAFQGHIDDDACLANDGEDCLEANLDGQYLMGISQYTPTTSYYWNSTSDFMLEWIQSVADMENPPLVFSISYGGYESQYSQSYVDAFNLEAMKLGVRGVSIMAASGDDGVAGYLTRDKPDRCGYNPFFPASSPYVTAVGATIGPESGGDEIVCQSDNNGVITTGGGFSNRGGLPSWQSDVVNAYFERVSGTSQAPVSGYATNSRGYPDVSLLGAWYMVMAGGNFTELFGTSASSPVFGAMVSLVNAARLKIGKPSLGWLNPSIYALSSLFIRDITSGDNFCVATNTKEVCCDEGFYATTGWDPVTGLGSVDYTAFYIAFMNISVPTAAPTRAPTLHPSFGPGSPTPEPTIAPTEAPTEGSTGWASFSYRTGSICDGTEVRVAAYTTGVCFPLYTKDGSKVYGSFRVACDGEDFVQRTYTVAECEAEFFYDEYKLSLACYTIAQDDYYYSTEVGTALLSCSNDFGTLPLQTDVQYAVTKYYDSEQGCGADGELTMIYANKLDHCIEFKQGGTQYSKKYTTTDTKTYTGVNCRDSKLVNTEAYYDGCLDLNTAAVSTAVAASEQPSELETIMTLSVSLAAEEDDFLTYYSAHGQTFNYVSFDVVTGGGSASPSQTPTTIQPTFPITRDPTEAPVISHAPSVSPTSALPTIAPSRAPSFMPTELPTNANLDIVLSVTQTLEGISAETYNEDREKNDNVLTAAISDTLNGYGVSSGAITITNVTAPSASSAAMTASSFRRRLQTDSCVLAYDVEMNTNDAGFSTAAEATAGVTTTLEAAVTSGDFDSSVHTYAGTFSASGMASVTSGDVSVTLTSSAAPSDDATDDGDSSTSADRTLVIGLIAGIGGGLVLLIVLMALTFCCGGSDKAPVTPAR